MSLPKTVKGRKHTSHHQRISLCEDGITDVVTFSIKNTAILDNVAASDSDWFETTARRPGVLLVQENDADQTWATNPTDGVTAIGLDPGRYLFTVNILVESNEATAMGYRFALTDNAATPVAYYATSAASTDLPAAAVSGQTVGCTKDVLVDLSDAVGVSTVHYVHCERNNHAVVPTLVRGPSSEITVRRLG